MRRLLLLLLAAPAFADPVEDAAEKALAAYKAGDAAALKALAEEDDPDPWLVADELCARGEHDAAEALAKAAPRKDVERLPEYVSSRRGKAADVAARATLAVANAALAANDFAGALNAVESATPPKEGEIVAIRLGHCRGIALRGLKRPVESTEAFLTAGRKARELGWLGRAARALHDAAEVACRRSEFRAALALWQDRLEIDGLRRDSAGAAATLRCMGTVHYLLSSHRNALECYARALKLLEDLGDAAGVAATLGDLEKAYRAVLDHAKALECRQRALKLAQELGDPADAAATKALAAHNAGEAKTVKALAEQDEPDPWLVADELCARGEHDAAEAFAKAAPRKDVERLPEYVASQRGKTGDAATRAAIRRAQAAISAGDHQAALDELRIAEATGSLLSVRLYHCRALVERGLRRLDESAQAFLLAGEGAERLGWLKRAADTFYEAGCTHEEAWRPTDAARCWERKLAVEQARGNRDGMNASLSGISAVLHDAGDYRRSLEYSERCRALSAELGYRDYEANAMAVAAGTCLRLGDIPKSIELLDNAISIYEDLGAHARVADCLRLLGMAYEHAGNRPKALQLQEKALAIAEALDDTKRLCDALGSLSSTHFYIGDYSRALELQRRSLALAERLGDRRRVARAVVNVGTCHEALEEHAKAVEFLEKGIVMKEQLEDRAGLSAALDALGHVHVGLGDFRKAQGCYERALRLSEGIGDRPAAVSRTVNIGINLLRLGRVGEAAAADEAALREARRLGLSALEMCALTNLGGVHFVAGRVREGAACARSAIVALGRLASGLSDEHGAQLREAATQLFELGVACGHALADPAETSFFLESGRAGALLEGLQLRGRLQATVLPQELRDRLGRAGIRQLRALQEYRRALDQPDEARRLWGEVEAAREEGVAVVQRIQREAKAQAALLYPEADSLDTIRASLNDGEALVVYAFHEPRSVALVATRGEAWLADLGTKAALTEALRTFEKAVARPDERGVVAPPHERLPFLRERLAKLLIEPLKLRDTTKRLLISPDGLLAYVPFSTLTDREVVYVPSGTTYRLLLEERGRGGEKVLAIGDPDYAAFNQTAGADDGLEALPGTRAEAQAVGDVVLLGKDATRSGFADALGKRDRWRAVHFACHGSVDPDRPVLSTLALTAQGDDDGFLKCLDVYQMRIPADLVVLSACETGKGKIYRAEGVVGFTRAFMFAGAPRVIVSLWKVDDAATRALMEKFYELWKPGKLGAAAALRAAQEHVRSQERWRHPYFWAAWQLWGLPE